MSEPKLIDAVEEIVADRPAAAWRQDLVRVADYALVRVSALPYPDGDGHRDSAVFRRALHELVVGELRLRTLAGPVTDALHGLREEYGDDFHRRVVLPVRRDVYNRRQPRPVLRAAVNELCARLPVLARWLHAVDECERLRRELDRLGAPALAQDRATLAEVCDSEPLRQAVALSSSDLLHGVARAAAGGPAPDARARKAEPRILRYALRAASKTSPWSWFTSLGWGFWHAVDGDLGTGHLRPVSQPNRLLVAFLIRALLASPRLRSLVPHRLAPATVVHDQHIAFRRDVVTGARRIVLAHEESVTLPRTPVLRFLVSLLRDSCGGRTPDDLAGTLADRLSGMRSKAHAFVERLLDHQFLVPVEPVDPQGVDALRELAGWLDERGRPDQADLLRRIDRDSRSFARLPAKDRPAALRRMDGAWQQIFAEFGAVPPETSPVKEDVFRSPVALGRGFGERARGDLAKLAPLAELFDSAALVRGLVREDLVTRFGPGGRCRLSEVVADGAQLWAAAAAIAPDGTITPPPDQYPDLPPRLLALAALRREVTSAVRSHGSGGQDVMLSDQLLLDVAAALPEWLLRRPSSYSWFVQPFRHRSGTGWCVNRVGGGWGRYSSRFLREFGPVAIRAVSAQLRDTFRDRRVAQYRPQAGFNANLHPLLVEDEVGEDPAWCSLSAEELEVAHCPDTDDIRLVVAATGQPLDVLYLGFLVQPSLPDRTAPLYLDHASGRVSLTHLAPAVSVEVDGDQVWRRSRLSYGDVVLARRAWQLQATTKDAWRSDLVGDGVLPVAAVARWRALLDLPEATFLGRAGPDPSGGGPGDLHAYLNDPKPQFVDLGSALHLRCLARLLAKHSGGIQLEEALPVPGDGPVSRHAVELLVETYRGGTR